MSCVVAVIPSYQRLPELFRLLLSLENQTRRPDLVVVVDNAADIEVERSLEHGAWRGQSEYPITTSERVRHAPCNMQVSYLPLLGNPGCGAALLAGMKKAGELTENRVTHFLNLDDDVILDPETTQRLLHGIEISGCMAMVPQIIDAQGRLESGPQPVSGADIRLRKLVNRPLEWIRKAKKPFVKVRWFRGPCYMVSTHSVETVGYPRDDFWMLGEDIEYSLRLSNSGDCFVDLNAVVRHCPPFVSDLEATEKSHRMKFGAMLQNLFYMAAHLAHCRGVWRYIPGHCLRYLRTFPSCIENVAALALFCWKGVFLGLPAGKK